MQDRTVDTPRVRSLLVVLVAAALCLIALPAMPAQASEAPTRVTGGTVSWGVKESFRDYVTSAFAAGSVDPVEPATDDGSRTTFANSSGAWGSESGVVQAQGGVRFRAHSGALDFTLSKPRLERTGATAKLILEVRKGGETSSVHFADVALAGHEQVQGSTATISGAPTTLTAAGAGVLGGRYSENEAVDPFHASLQLGSTPAPEPTPEPTTPPTPEPTPEPTAPVEEDLAPLVWGVKKSFRDYIANPFVQGSVTLGDGVVRAADGAYRWPFERATAKAVHFGGSVTFDGHHGEMHVVMSKPQITLSSRTRATLTVLFNGDRVVLGTVALPSPRRAGDVSTFPGAAVTLSATGVPVFAYQGAGFYEAGELLDPATFEVPTRVHESFAAPNPGDPDEPDQPTRPKPTAPAKPTKPTVDREREAAKRGGKAGELTWGVKASFRTYITGPIAKGAISVSGGASSTGDAYRFGQSSTTATPPSATGTTTYGGAVKFYGHDGKLDRTISQPSVRVTSPLTAVLSANVTGMGRLDIATLSLSSARKSTEAGWVRYAGAPARLTAQGVAIFAYQGRGFYPAGTVLDPVTFSVGTTAAARASGGGASRVVAATNRATKWTPPAEPPSGTGLSVDQDDIQAGDEITATAEGFLPNETGIRVVLYSTPMVLAENVTADASGRATWKGAIPATIEPGRHTLTFQGSVDRGIVLDIAAADEIVGCKLADARLEWGFKESFRAYISGGIANGDWTTGGNAGYETPQFRWTKGTGVMAEKGDTGTLDFTGHVQFTGHDGALDTRVADPVVSFASKDKAVLALDYTGGTMDAALAGENDSRTIGDVPFADLDLAAGTVERQGDRVTISDIPATLTSAGSNAFPNYPAGTALDPVTLSYTTTKDCGAAASTKEQSKAATGAVALDPITATGSTTWWPWAVGGALLAGLAGAAGTFLVMRRRTPGADA